MATPTIYEQLILELINRARLDPLGEAARLSLSLNDGLAANTISTDQKQALAFNPKLGDSADAHSQWMLNTDTFSHTGVNGSNPGQRMLTAGYEGWTWGENIAWSGTTGTLDIASAAAQHHDMLFKSAGHRTNIMDADFREIGIGSISGQFASGGNNFNALMTTQNFAASGSAFFITGVVINDLDDDRFYDLNEGLGGVTVSLRNEGANVGSMATWSSGGYSLAVNKSGAFDVLFSGNGISAGVTVTVGDANAKVDLADANTILSSASATLLSGALHLKLLGINGISGTGNEGDNIITGNSGNNALAGLDGNDQLFGGAGNDRLEGGGGNDILRGEAGADILKGGAGDDIIYADASDNLLELSGGDGYDILYFSGDFTFDWQTMGFEAFNPTGGGPIVTPPPTPPAPPPPMVATEGADTFNGTEERDEFNALGGNDILKGNGGNDWLNGGAGADKMTGGWGDDTYLVDSTSDTITELAGQGFDTIVTSLASFNLARFTAIEALTYDNGEGVDGNFVGTGNGLANVITGGDGNDSINGGLGADLMRGGNGNDSYTVDNVGDRIEDTGGYDRVTSSVSFVMSGGLDALTLTGRVAINGTGNELGNTITGNAYANIINGGGGADWMGGGSGNDTYIVDNVGDVVSEAARGGTDKVLSSVSFTLGANVENLTLIGEGSIDGYGNTLANTMVGNNGNNRLDGGTGADRMSGGFGDDTYVVDNTRDVVTELAGQGNDTIVSRLASFSLAQLGQIENLTYDNGAAADAAFTGTGNALDNTITGGAASDRLSGGAGNDTLIGGLGNDTLTGGLGGDHFVFSGAIGKDTVTDFGAGDMLLLDEAYGFNDDTLFTQFSVSGSDLVLNLGEAGSITLKGAAGLALTADSFDFFGMS